MTQDFDLFGNPMPSGDPKRGRPEHVPTEENIIFVMVLLAAGHSNKEVAETMGLTVPTLRKHYFHLLKKRDLMLDRIQTKLRVSQIKQGLAGNASALNAALTTLDKVKAEGAGNKVKHRADKPSTTTKAPKLGKKEERQLAATNVGGKYATPSAPKLIVDNR